MRTPNNAQEKLRNGQLTMWGLYKALEKYCKRAGAHINAPAIVSDDVECNGYHGLFFGIEEHDYTAGLTDYLSDTTHTAIQPLIA